LSPACIYSCVLFYRLAVILYSFSSKKQEIFTTFFYILYILLLNIVPLPLNLSFSSFSCLFFASFLQSSHIALKIFSCSRFSQHTLQISIFFLHRCFFSYSFLFSFMFSFLRSMSNLSCALLQARHNLASFFLGHQHLHVSIVIE